MAEPRHSEAAVVETLKGAITKDGQFALIRAVRPNASPSGADDIDLALPIPMLPKVLGLVLHLIDAADKGLRAGSSKRRCFEASTVDLSETPDGRQALTFELVIGGKISIAVDDEQARKISEGFARRLADEKAPATSRKPH